MRGWRYGSLVGCLLTMYEAPGSITVNSFMPQIFNWHVPESFGLGNVLYSIHVAMQQGNNGTPHCLEACTPPNLHHTTVQAQAEKTAFQSLCENLSWIGGPFLQPREGELGTCTERFAGLLK